MSSDGVEQVPSPGPAEMPGDPLAAVEALLGGVQAAPGEAEETPPSPEPAAEMPAFDLPSVAERLGVEPSELYEKLTLKTADGQEHSLGSIKDRLQKLSEVEKVELELTRQRGEFEADRIRAERELGRLLQAIPKDRVDPQLVEIVKAQEAERAERGREELYRVMPEWAIPEKRGALKDAVLESARAYRISPAEMEQVSDYRLLWMLSDLHRMKAAARAAEKQPEPKVASRPRAAKEPSPAQKLGHLKAAVTTRRISPETAVAKLLGDAGVKTRGNEDGSQRRTGHHGNPGSHFRR